MLSLLPVSQAVFQFLLSLFQFLLALSQLRLLPMALASDGRLPNRQLVGSSLHIAVRLFEQPLASLFRVRLFLRCQPPGSLFGRKGGGGSLNGRFAAIQIRLAATQLPGDLGSLSQEPLTFPGQELQLITVGVRPACHRLVLWMAAQHDAFEEVRVVEQRLAKPAMRPRLQTLPPSFTGSRESEWPAFISEDSDGSSNEHGIETFRPGNIGDDGIGQFTLNLRGHGDESGLGRLDHSRRRVGGELSSLRSRKRSLASRDSNGSAREDNASSASRLTLGLVSSARCRSQGNGSRSLRFCRDRTNSRRSAGRGDVACWPISINSSVNPRR